MLIDKTSGEYVEHTIKQYIAKVDGRKLVLAVNMPGTNLDKQYDTTLSM